MSKFMTEHDLNRLIMGLDFDDMNLDKTEINTSNESKDLNGWVIVEDNKIHIQNAPSGGKKAMIAAIPPMEIMINGIKLDNMTEVTDDDLIQWKVSEEPMYEVTVSEDKMLAFFKLNSLEKTSWVLVDHPKAFKAYLKAERDPKIVFESLQLNEIVTWIVKKGILYNLDILAIQNELDNPTFESIIIARGKPVVPGKDAKLDTFFEEQVQNEFNVVGGVVDYRDHLHIPTVNKGEVIAKKTMMREGSIGYNVYGQVMTPAAVKDITLIGKDYIKFLADGRIVAMKEGRPRVTGSHKVKYFDISTAYIISGNVDLETGNICFSGDIVVYGDVMDNMILESLGNIYVSGNVYNATLTATGSICVKGNVVGSKLYSGYFGVLFNRLYHGTKQLLELFEKLLKAADMLQIAIQKTKQKINYGQIIQLLIETKIKEIPQMTKELLFVIANIQNIDKEQLNKVKQMLEIFLQPIKLVELMQVNLLHTIINLVRQTNEEVARMQETKSIIEIQQCHLSTLKSNGDIIIKQDGVIQSDLFSSRNIIFRLQTSVCRGSNLESDGHISAMIVGGQTGTNTILKAKRRVTIQKMYSGRVCIGRYCEEIIETIENRTFEAHNMRSEALIDRAND